MEWGNLFSSEQALGMYGAIVLLIYNYAKHYLKTKHQFNCEQFEGLAKNAYLIAEGLGKHYDWSAITKLESAKTRFAADYETFYGKKPSLKQIQKVVADFGKFAYESYKAKGGTNAKNEDRLPKSILGE